MSCAPRATQLRHSSARGFAAYGNAIRRLHPGAADLIDVFLDQLSLSQYKSIGKFVVCSWNEQYLLLSLALVVERR